jgi:hypothetical protein
MRLIINFLLLILIVACSKGTEEEFADAKFQAYLYLSENQCASARTTLLAVGDSTSTDFEFLQLLASSYACTAGYSDLDFFDEASTKLTSGSTDFLNSLATFDDSTQETSAESSSFTNLMTAIEIVTAGGGNSAATHAGRESVFGEDDTQNLNLQALFMVAQGLGKFVHFYGDANASTGIKTQCVYNYTVGLVQTYIDGATTGSCTGPGYTGGITGTDATAVRRLCQGTVLYNQLINLFLNTTLSTSDDYGDLDLVYTNIQAAYSAFCALGVAGNSCAQMDVASCETEYAADTTDLQFYFAYIFDTTFL